MIIVNSLVSICTIKYRFSISTCIQAINTIPGNRAYAATFISYSSGYSFGFTLIDDGIRSVCIGYSGSGHIQV